jgi:hypothetical protein
MATAKTTSNKSKSDGKAIVEAAADIRAIVLPELDVRQAILHVVGISPLIMHRWSEKALRALEDAQTGKAKQQKAARVPDEEWRAAAYVVPGKEDAPDWKPGKYFFPASAFKHAFLYGVSQFDDKRIPKTRATGWVYIDEDPVLAFESVVLRTDIGRNPTQPIYRPQFNGWSLDLFLGYNARAITLEQVVAIMDMGGFAGGIGEWRPSAPKNKTGSFGRFRINGVETR